MIPKWRRLIVFYLCRGDSQVTTEQLGASNLLKYRGQIQYCLNLFHISSWGIEQTTQTCHKSTHNLLYHSLWNHQWMI